MWYRPETQHAIHPKCSTKIGIMYHCQQKTSELYKSSNSGEASFVFIFRSPYKNTATDVPPVKDSTNLFVDHACSTDQVRRYFSIDFLRPFIGLDKDEIPDVSFGNILMLIAATGQRKMQPISSGSWNMIVSASHFTVRPVRTQKVLMGCVAGERFRPRPFIRMIDGTLQTVTRLYSSGYLPAH